MKELLKFLNAVAGVLLVIWDLVEIFTIPAIFLLIGLFNSFGWKYYAITIGGYFVIAAIIQIVSHLIFKKFEKKFATALDRLFSHLFDKKKDE